MAKVQHIKLQKLLQVEPFKIVGLWSNGETRLNDFSSDVEKWRNSTNKELKKLVNPKVFKTAFIKEGTLAFAGSTVQVPGIPGPQPVDFDRRTLYTDSQLIGNVVSYEDAIRHQKSRADVRRRRVSAVARTEHNSLDRKNEVVDKLSQKIGGPVTPLLVIGDELVELETKWIVANL